MFLIGLRRHNARRRPGRRFAVVAEVEGLEGRRLLTFPSPTISRGTNSFGINGVQVHSPAAVGDSTIHNFNFFLNNDAGLSTATINASQLDPGGATVHANIS